MMNLVREKEESRKKIILSAIIAMICIIAAVPLILIAEIFEMPIFVRVALFVTAAIVIITGIAVACILDRDAGAFECPECHSRFVPDMREYVTGLHTLTKRKLRCPQCGKVSYCKHVLSR